MGATARADSPTEGVVPTEKDRTDRTAEVVPDSSHTRDVDNIKADNTQKRGRGRGTDEGTGSVQRICGGKY